MNAYLTLIIGNVRLTGRSGYDRFIIYMRE